MSLHPPAAAAAPSPEYGRERGRKDYLALESGQHHRGLLLLPLLGSQAIKGTWFASISSFDEEQDFPGKNHFKSQPLKHKKWLAGSCFFLDSCSDLNFRSLLPKGSHSLPNPEISESILLPADLEIQAVKYDLPSSATTLSLLLHSLPRDLRGARRRKEKKAFQASCHAVIENGGWCAVGGGGRRGGGSSLLSQVLPTLESYIL